MEPIPGGFPSAKRNQNAVQVRVSSGGVAAIESDPAALIGGALGGSGTPGVIQFNAPASCSGTVPICCPGGQPQANCGPIDIDLNRVGNEAKRLELKPTQGQSKLDVVVRTRIKTESAIPVKVPVVGDCGLSIDSTKGGRPDVEIHAPITFAIDGTQAGGATANTTRVVVGTISLKDQNNNDTLEGADLSLKGLPGAGTLQDLACQGAGGLLSLAIGVLSDQLTGQIQSAIQDQTCKACPSGDVAECGPFASACTDNVCQEGNQCLQELGLSGRARGTALFGSLSPGTTGALDLYEVAGGQDAAHGAATTNGGGIALALMGGMVPGGTARDKCGPPATEPAMVQIPQSAFFQGNTRPDNSQPFDVAFGVHKSQLDSFAYAGYDGGLLCLTISSNTVSQLSTDTLALLSRSLGKLNENNSPVAVGLRPQSPPVITLGRNIFTDDGMGGKTLTEALLDIKFNQLEIDFFAAVDDQYIRVFTVVTDVHFPVGLQVTAMGELAPVIANPDDAFTNVSVKNTEALTETPQELADLFPSLLSLVLPQLSNGLAPISLPTLGGLQLSITDVTAVDNVSFLAIFANLAPAAFQKPVHTMATIGEVYDPPADEARHPSRWKRAVRQPSVALNLATTDATDVEYSWQIDAGAWSAWSTNARPTLTSPVFWLPGQHKIEVRARRIGKPETIDLSPVSLVVELGANAGVRKVPFHGSPGSAAGCNCDSSNNAAAALPFMLLILALVFGLRMPRVRLRKAVRRLKRFPAIIWLAAVMSLPGCSCGSDYCGDSDCIAGDLDHGGYGRWTSIAADDKRVMVAMYDQGLGDVVAADVTSPDAPVFVVVDGIPTDSVPTHSEDSYRKGIEEPGPDVGAWTSIKVRGGLGMISYQDRDAGALKFARETKKNQWTSFVVDAGNGEEVGRYTSLVIDANGHPTIAYTALANDDGMGHRVTELRLARAGAQDPKANEWSSATIASGLGTCAGLCSAGEACIDTADGQTCTATTSDCTATCGDTEACVNGACVAAFAEPTVTDIATGTGLFTDLVLLPDGRLAAVYYDRNARSLVIAVESGPDTNTFTETVLDGGGATDRGMWASAVVDDAGTVHIAYQDALGDQLFYTTWNGTPGTPELVDDGTRAGETRVHNVGAATAIFLASGAPQIAYQDGLTADVYLATKSGASWSTTGISVSPLLDGFSIGATTGHGQPYLAWDRLDPAQSPPNGLFVQAR